MRREFWQYSRKCLSVYAMSGALPGWPEKLGAKLRQLGLTEHQSFYTGSSHLAPISLLPAWWSQGISELQEQTLFVKKWKLPNSSGLDPNIGKASLLAYSISQGTQVHWEVTPLSERVSKNLWTFSLCQSVLGPAPWFLHSPIPQLLIWTINESTSLLCEKN